jgi:hypothetical protein
VRTLVTFSLDNPRSDDPLPTAAAHESLEHTNHVDSSYPSF